MNKIHTSLSPLCVFSLTFLTIALVSVGKAESISKEDFVRESTKAWDELLSIYKKRGVSISYQWKQTYSDDDPYVHSRVCILGNYQLNESEIPNDPDTKKYIQASNDRYSFQISKEQNANWVIRDIVEDLEGMNETDNNLNLMSMTPRLYEGLIVQDSWLKDIVTSDSFVIKSINESNDKQNQISIDFSADYKISSVWTLTNGTLVFDKNQYWIVRHSKVAVIETITDKPVEYLITTDKEYKSIDGIPFPATIITTLALQNTATSSVPMQKIDRYDDPKIGDISKNEFYLSYYGIAEPAISKSRIDTLRFLFILIGVLLIGIGLYLKIRASKASNA